MVVQADPKVPTDRAEELFRANFQSAYDQCLAPAGKGMARHGHSRPLSQQPWLAIARELGPEFLLGQAVKKILEAARLDKAAGARELLGAMVYINFALVFGQLEDK